MGLFTGGTKKKPRSFRYKPRFYDPEDDDQARREERVKERMQIKSKTRRGKSSSLLYLILILAFTVYLYVSL